MSNDREERNRVLGLPMGTGPRGRQGEEQQHVMGLPADLFKGANLDGLSFLAHPIRAYKRWTRRRRLGPYATEEGERLPYGSARTQGRFPVGCSTQSALNGRRTILPWANPGTPWRHGFCGCDLYIRVRTVAVYIGGHDFDDDDIAWPEGSDIPLRSVYPAMIEIRDTR